jgi:4-hydroxybenzoate polyprenyltransferase
MTTLREQFPFYLSLIRFDRPIGTYLLLWPTLWALWLASEGMPDSKLLVIFTLGTFLMRSAGCIINDFADRNIDGRVERTATRPLASGQVSTKEALTLFALLCLLSFALVLLTNKLTVYLSFVAVALASCYPFMKRYTYLPQVVLGAAFAWGIPMAFAAELNELPQGAWLIYVTVLIWTVIYDTFYAMVDRDDDMKIGLKSTAILFGRDDKRITGFMQGGVILSLLLIGNHFQLSYLYYIGVVTAAGLFVYQQYLIRDRQRDRCFKAFLNNQWVGAAVFAGIFSHYMFNG